MDNNKVSDGQEMPDLKDWQREVVYGMSKIVVESYMIAEKGAHYVQDS